MKSRDHVKRAINHILDGDHDDGPRVIFPSTQSPLWEPSDAKDPVTVASLATTAAGGNEQKFGLEGMIVPGPGAIGAYWSRATKSRWTPLTPGRPIPYTPDGGFFVGKSATGLLPSGVLTLEFYAKPPATDWDEFRKWVFDWTRINSSESAVGALIQNLIAVTGTDSTLGTFSHLFSAGAEQIFLAGSNMLVGGATAHCLITVNAPYTNTDEVYVGETAALAVASNNALSATGESTWSIPAGGKLFFKSATGTQKLSARMRS